MRWWEGFAHPISIGINVSVARCVGPLRDLGQRKPQLQRLPVRQVAQRHRGPPNEVVARELVPILHGHFHFEGLVPYLKLEDLVPHRRERLLFDGTLLLGLVAAFDARCTGGVMRCGVMGVVSNEQCVVRGGA